MSFVKKGLHRQAPDMRSYGPNIAYGVGFGITLYFIIIFFLIELA